jgi:hypothetical protein
MPLIDPKVKKRRLKLLNIPEDVYCILLQEQAKIKGAKKIGMFGMERTIYAIIREHKRCEEK